MEAGGHSAARRVGAGYQQVRASRAMDRDVVRIRLVSDLRQMHDAIERACATVGDVLARLEVIISGLRLDPARMRANLAIDDGLITAEAVMIKLVDGPGRARRSPQAAGRASWLAARRRAGSACGSAPAAGGDFSIVATLAGSRAWICSAVPWIRRIT